MTHRLISLKGQVLPNRKGIIVAIALLVTGLQAHAGRYIQGESDSVKHWYIKPRLYSSGFFQLAGLLFNQNATMDLSITHTGRYGSLTVVKSQDLEDGRSGVNYMFAGYFKAIKVSKRLYITPFAGYFTPQTQKVVGEAGSSPIFSVTGTYTINRFTIDNTVIGSGLINQPGTETMINRLQVKYQNDFFSISAFTWYNLHNLSEGGKGEYFSGSLEVDFHQVKVSEKIKFNCGVTAYRYIKGEENANLRKGGLIFNISYPLNF